MKEKQEGLLQAMEKEAAEERRKLEEAYQKQVQEIKEATEKEVRRLREEELRLVDKKLVQEQARRVGKADQEGRNSILLAKHRMVEGILNGVEKDLLKIRQQKELYSRLFREMLLECLGELSGEVTVRVNPADNALCQAVVSEQKRNARIEEDGKILGGVIVVGQNGRTMVLNSLESRAVKGRELAVEEVARFLFKEVS
jgi:vacuolar-type H+-ATPase subunit E/Vma4